MNFVYQKLHAKASIIACITFCCLFLNEFAYGSEHVIKTIQSANGEVIECIDIKKQPAFDHPLLANHFIERLEGSGNNASEIALSQEWNKNGEHCPDGSIPVVRKSNFKNLRRVAAEVQNPVKRRENAQVRMAGPNYGANAKLNIWTPQTDPSDVSLAKISVTAGQNNELNSVEAGWMAKNGAKFTTIFIYWTKDNSQSTGCYNLDCPGFVQTNNRIVLGGTLTPISTYNGRQIDFKVSIYQNRNTGNWWVALGGVEVGYWPASLFTTLAEEADSISWRGEVTHRPAAGTTGRVTPTSMGSGHYPSEGYGKASYFAFLKYVGADRYSYDAKGLTPSASNPSCYDVALNANANTNLGVHFFYGGPGNLDKCP